MSAIFWLSPGRAVGGDVFEKNSFRRCIKASAFPAADYDQLRDSGVVPVLNCGNPEFPEAVVLSFGAGIGLRCDCIMAGIRRESGDGGYSRMPARGSDYADYGGANDLGLWVLRNDKII